jgi:hypothetical protein
VIVRVRVERLILPAARDAADLRALQSAVTAAVRRHVAQATLGRGTDAGTIAAASRLAGKEVAAHCLAGPPSRP